MLFTGCASATSYSLLTKTCVNTAKSAGWLRMIILCGKFFTEIDIKVLRFINRYHKK